jgi:cell division protein FtsX
MKATWRPNEKHGQLDADDRNDLPDSAYAFPDKRKEPLTDAKHVRNAIARFNQVQDVTDAEREQAFANIKRAASHYDVDLSASSWRELGKPS